MNRRAQTILVTAGVALLVLSAATPASAKHPDPALVVDLEEDGSAVVTLRLTYDLSSSAERSAFEELQNSESERREMLDRFQRRMSRVANASENATGRSMSVTSDGVELSTTADNFGVVWLAVQWDGLAATRDGRLVVTTPFTEDYDPDRKLVITGPKGYEVADATPEPSSRDGRMLRWDADTSLDGFSVTYAPAGETGETTTAGGAGTTAGDGSGGAAPGFGAPAALAALLAVAVALARRR